MENDARPTQQSVNSRELNHNDLLIANDDVAKTERVLDGNHVPYSLEERLKPLTIKGGRIPGQYIVVIRNSTNPEQLPDFQYVKSVSDLLKSEDIPVSFGKQSFTTTDYRESQIDDEERSGNNARRISSTFKKNLPVRPRAITGSIDERNPNVLNLQEQQNRNSEQAQKFNEPDIYDEKVIENTEESKRRIDEEKLEQYGPENEEEAIAAAEQVYSDADLPVNAKMVQSLRQKTDYAEEKIEEPLFPVIIVTFAIMKDILDVFLTLGIETVVLLIIAEIFSTLFGIAIFIWLLSKSQLKNRKLFRKQIKGSILTFIIEEIPILQILPTETIFIIWTYIKEKQDVKKQKEATQKLKKMKVIT